MYVHVILLVTGLILECMLSVSEDNRLISASFEQHIKQVEHGIYLLMFIFFVILCYSLEVVRSIIFKKIT